MHRHFRFSAFLFAAISLPLLCPAHAQQFRADGQKAKSYIDFLASNELRGRETLTPDYRKAAEYVAARFKEWGLKPSGDEGTSYFQKVPIKMPITRNSGIPQLDIDGRPFYFDDSDFTVNSLSTQKTAVKAEVLFVGYGMSLPAKGLDEYAGLNVQGKVVLAYKGSPENFSLPRGIFTESPAKPPAPFGFTPEEVSDVAKIRTAFDKGAAAILLYNPDLPSAVYSRQPSGAGVEINRNFLAFDITERVFRSILKKAPEESLSERAAKLNAVRWDIRNRKPGSRATGAVASLQGYTEITKYSGDGLNVIGKIEGTDPVLKNQYIVLGGHLDHVGAQGTVVYNGADDDASGVATVMEVARVLGQAQYKPKRTIVFAAWSGEEMGLLGSDHFGSNPPAGIKMEQVVANFNCDMVGLGNAIGAPGALNFPEIWEKVIKRNQDPDVIAAVRPSTGGPGGSDHSTFITKGIVSMALMTEGGSGHPDYHGSGDDAQKIDPEILRKTCQFVLQGTRNLADETAVNLLVPDRQYLYNSLMMRVTNINPQLAGSTWRNSDYPTRVALLARMYELEVVRNAREQARLQAEAAARAVGPVMVMPPPAQASPPQPARKNLSAAVPSAAFGGDSKFMEVSANAIGFGRVEFSTDDGVWIVNRRFTDAGKAALKTMEANNIVLHLVSPTDDLLSDALNAAERPFIVTGTYNLAVVPKDVAVAKKIILSVDFDPSDVAATVERADQAKKQIGAAANLIAFVKSTDQLNVLEVKRALYFGLIKKGWTADEISTYIGGSLRTLMSAVNPPAR